MKRTRNPYYNGPVTDHFDGMRFFAQEQPGDKTLPDLWRWRREGGRAQWPAAYPSPFQEKPPASSDRLRITLIGHASFLVQVAGLNLLVDPVFAKRASPLPFAGPKRVNEPGVAFEDLPPIHAVLITHNHYDHLDMAAIGRLWRRDRPRFIAPLGNDAVIRRRYPEIAVETGDWGTSLFLANGVTAHFEPSYHWSARGMRDRRMALWCAYVLTTPQGVLYHVGDTGFGDGAIFSRIRERFGAPRLAHLPIGAYEPRWFMQPQHMNPDEAVKAFRLLGATQALGHHWGTFQLTNEAIEEPPQALAAALREAGISGETFRALRPGEVWELRSIG
ncbi:MBL fold metallo-hydrolase [Microvirga flavescens]|uniref:MBL fold metallo-hydrolase n=1 Tax=Microvirga flavescens TaxID=2249811 RepID=UPI000DD91419|nr:MBL fold metallo-hydrolase [Microvirga flavescens]